MEYADSIIHKRTHTFHSVSLIDSLLRIVEEDMMQEDVLFVSRTDVLATVPMITSYSVWIHDSCPPRTERIVFLAELEGIINKVRAIAEQREETITRELLPLTANEARTLGGVLVYFTMTIDKTISDDTQRTHMYGICDRMRDFLRDNYPLPVSQH